jgi:TPR repeat protein
MPIALRFSITLVLSIVCLATPAWADFEADMKAYKGSDYATALREWQPLAEQGDANAQFNLGMLYTKGLGVQQDYGQARQWFEKAAAQGLARAHFYLGVLHARGEGVPPDYVHAQSYERAIAQGYARAQFNLGVLYGNRQGVP